MDWAGVSRILSSTPARIARLSDQGRVSAAGVLETGAPANLTVYDPHVTRTVDPATHATRSRNSPYRGMELPGQVTDVFNHGHPVVRDRALATPRTH
jgi:dihydroorotase